MKDMKKIPVIMFLIFMTTGTLEHSAPEILTNNPNSGIDQGWTMSSCIRRFGCLNKKSVLGVYNF